MSQGPFENISDLWGVLGIAVLLFAAYGFASFMHWLWMLVRVCP